MIERLNLEDALAVLRRAGQLPPLTKSESELLQFVVDGLVNLTTLDSLTGLGNRRRMEEEADRCLRLKKRGVNAVLLAVDLDNFKRVNDDNNHLIGDEILKQTAVVLRRCVRDTDTVIRMGGDEFAMILHDTEIELATNIANRVVDAIGSEYFTESGIQVTASVGLAEIQYGDTADSWWKRADLRMFDAKRNGKNGVVVDELQAAG